MVESLSAGRLRCVDDVPVRMLIYGGDKHFGHLTDFGKIRRVNKATATGADFSRSEISEHRNLVALNLTTGPPFVGVFLHVIFLWLKGVIIDSNHLLSRMSPGNVSGDLRVWVFLTR